MRLIPVLVVVLFMSFQVKAQEVDKGSWYGHLVIGSAVNDYKDYLDFYNVKKTKLGLDFGYLFNIQRRSHVNSPMQIGVELGFMPMGTDNVDSQVGGNFTHAHRSFRFNGVARYRPVLSASQVNPFFDLFFGPELVTSRVTEILSSDETSNVLSYSNWTRNYGVGGGVGFKRENRSGQLRYIDIGLYYKYSEKVRSIRRNSFFILSDGSTGYEETIIKPTTIQIKLGLTGFL